MQQKVIVITGVTRGLGRALALHLAQLGHRVAGCGRRRSDLDRLAAALGSGHSLASVDVAADDDLLLSLGPRDNGSALTVRL